VTYAVLIDELVLRDDFKGIELHHQRKIIKTIRERLSVYAAGLGVRKNWGDIALLAECRPHK
jgi:hypothetical protein